MRKDCTQAAKWQLGWKVWPFGQPKTSPGIIGHVGLAVCDAHLKDTVKHGVTAFMTKEGFARINQILQQAGKVAADFSKAEVIYDELVDDKLHFPQGGQH